MNAKKKNTVNEPSQVYQSPEIDAKEENLHPILEKLLEKSLKEADEGRGISNEEMQRRIKERYPFLK